MNTILSFDISSSVIGWSKIEYDEKETNLVSYGNFKPIKSESLEDRLVHVQEKIRDICVNNASDFYAVESYANKFSSGRSTANTIRILSIFKL